MSHIRSRGFDVVSSPYVPEGTVYMLQGTHANGVTIITDEATGQDMGAAVSEIMNRDQAESLFGVDAVTYADWQSRRVDIGGTLTVNHLREASLRALEDHGRPDMWDTFVPHLQVSEDNIHWSPAAAETTITGLGGSYVRVGDSLNITGSVNTTGTWTVTGNAGGTITIGQTPNGSEDAPWVLEKREKVQLSAARAGWYKFSHIPNVIFDMPDGLVALDVNDYPMCYHRRKKV